MRMIARIIGLVALCGGLGAGLGYALYHQYDDWEIPSFLFACIGIFIGTVAGSAREIVIAQRQGLEAEKKTHNWRIPYLNVPLTLGLTGVLVTILWVLRRL